MSFMSPRDRWIEPNAAVASVDTSQLVDEANFFQTLERHRALTISRFNALIPVLVLVHVLGGAVISWFALAGAPKFDALTLTALTLFADIVIFVLMRRHRDGQFGSHRIANAITFYSLVSGALFAASVVFGVPEGNPFLHVSFILLLCVTSVIILVLSSMPVAAMVQAIGPIVAMIGLAPGSLPGWLFGVSVMIMGIVSYLGTRNADQYLRAFVAESRTDQKFAELAQDFERTGAATFWETDRSNRLTYFSTPAARRFQFNIDGLSSRTLGEFFLLPGGGDDSDTLLTADFLISSRQSFENTPTVTRQDAVENWWSLTGHPVIDDRGRFSGYRGYATELTGELRNDAATAQRSRFDTLTGLAGRALIQETLERSIPTGDSASAGCALMMLDLDRFKQVNDTLGHPVGDELLKLVAERLRTEIGDAGRIGRLGGDEFMVVLPGETSRVTLSKLARATIETLSKKYQIKDSTISIGASIGIAVAPYDAQSSESLISMADMALYAAKSDGRGVHRFYDAQMTDADSERRRMRLDLRNTLATKGIVLAYQPFVESETGKILGFEALARWEHPHKGTILPAILFPLAESATLDLQLGDVILAQACHQATKWPSHLRVAVNVSKGQIESGTLVKSIEQALDASGLSPSRLEIDIAETTFRDCRDKAEQTATELRRMGARVALDDFGAGDTCLANFKCTAIDKIKLDPSFIVGAADSQRRDAAILRSIAGLAESLGIDTLAEGVESEEDATLAKILGCQSMQGFAFGKPVGPDKIPELIAENDKRQTTEREEARKATRTALFRAAMLYFKDRDYKVVIRNISQLGASIECPRIFPPDSVVALDIGVGDPVAARVAWSDTHRMGLKFVQPFDMKTMKAIPRTAMPLLH